MALNFDQDAQPALSDHYRGYAMDVATGNLPKWLCRKPRVVLWGGYRDDDVQFGSPEDREWENSRGPFRPVFKWLAAADHVHLAVRRRRA